MQELFGTLALSALLIGTCLYLHFRVLRAIGSRLAIIREKFRYPMLVVMSVIFLTHIAEIIIFTAAFWVMALTGIGSLAGAHSSTVADFFYFSIASYTTLGIGDITPKDAIRVVAGLEALTGLLLIAWSASFTYLLMERVWAPEKDQFDDKTGI